MEFRFMDYENVWNVENFTLKKFQYESSAYKITCRWWILCMDHEHL